jgi:hypothetical protein
MSDLITTRSRAEQIAVAFAVAIVGWLAAWLASCMQLELLARRFVTLSRNSCSLGSKTSHVSVSAHRALRTVLDYALFFDDTDLFSSIARTAGLNQRHVRRELGLKSGGLQALTMTNL